MSRSVVTVPRSQQALQSYLDNLLQEAAVDLAQSESVSLDEFEAAVREEQERDARMIRPQALAQASPSVVPVAPIARVEVEQRVVEPMVLEPVAVTPPISFEGRPSWAEEPFECLLFDVAGLTLAVPLICIGTIFPLAADELTPLFGQPDWFLGILASQAGNLKVLDTARWVMPERYRDDFRRGLSYVISVNGFEWGLAVHQVSRSIRLRPDEIKWRNQRHQRPWLAGTVIEHMCALLDVEALAALVASGGAQKKGR
jgi:purine-binding chemotaxis protein CheW